MTTWVPQAKLLSSQPLAWRCRCSQTRAEGAMATLSRQDVQAMIDAGEPAHVDCEFCGSVYTISQAALIALLAQHAEDDIVH